MKRVPITLQEYLRRVLTPTSLNSDECRWIEAVLATTDPNEITRLTQELLRSLVERGRIEVISRRFEGSEERWLIQDLEHRIRVRLRFPVSPLEPAFRRIELPLSAEVRPPLQQEQVQALLALFGGLISSGRVMSPRDLAQRLPQVASELLPGVRAEFYPLTMPEGDHLPDGPWAELPRERGAIEAMVQSGDHVLAWPDTASGGSLLLTSISDESTGWTGLLAFRHESTDHFSGDTLGLVTLLAQHFRMLFSTATRLQGLIFYDFLTGIYNRSYFEEQLEREIHLARRRDQELALLIVDIDNFKTFNTNFGYEGGDRALATVACVLRAALRNTDTLARYGGEEFAIILAPPIPMEEARRIAERLRAAVEDEFLSVRRLTGETLRERVSISIGGALHPAGGATPRELWTSANRCLLEAKSLGKNQVRFHGD